MTYYAALLYISKSFQFFLPSSHSALLGSKKKTNVCIFVSLSFPHAPNPLTGRLYEITPSLGKSRSPCLGPLMSLFETRRRHQTTSVWTHRPELNTKGARDKLLEYSRRVLLQPLLSFVAWLQGNLGEQTGAELSWVQTAEYKYRRVAQREMDRWN